MQRISRYSRWCSALPSHLALSRAFTCLALWRALLRPACERSKVSCRRASMCKTSLRCNCSFDSFRVLIKVKCLLQRAYRSGPPKRLCPGLCPCHQSHQAAPFSGSHPLRGNGQAEQLQFAAVHGTHQCTSSRAHNLCAGAWCNGCCQVTAGVTSKCCISAAGKLPFGFLGQSVQLPDHATHIRTHSSGARQCQRGVVTSLLGPLMFHKRVSLLGCSGYGIAVAGSIAYASSKPHQL